MLIAATKPRNAAQPLRIQELAAGKLSAPVQLAELTPGDKPLPRTSAGQSKTLTRTTSHNSLATTARATDSHRVSAISADSTTSTSTVQPKNKEEAVLKTMRSLEGTRRLERTKSRDVLNAITRPAPSPPLRRSFDVQIEKDTRASKDEQRRSLGIERTLADLKEESPARSAVQSPGELLWLHDL